MKSNTKTLIIDGKLIDLDKTPIEDLKKIQKDLMEREKEIRRQIEEELENYETKSVSNIIYKKANSMEQEEIKQYLLKKGYKIENINNAIEE